MAENFFGLKGDYNITKLKPMKKNETEYDQIVSLFQELNKKYPSYSIGRHISTALDEYNDLWGLTNKEFLFALNKYATTLEIDNSFDDNKFLSKIIEDGEHLFDETTEDEDFEDEYEF
jgi:hypothetical protein